MDAPNARALDELTNPRADHDMEVTLPGGGGQLFSGEREVKVRLLKAEGERVYPSRQVVSGYLVPTDIAASPCQWEGLYKEVRRWCWEGNTPIVADGSYGAKAKVFFAKKLRCALGRGRPSSVDRQVSVVV